MRGAWSRFVNQSNGSTLLMTGNDMNPSGWPMQKSAMYRILHMSVYDKYEYTDADPDTNSICRMQQCMYSQHRLFIRVGMYRFILS